MENTDLSQKTAQQKDIMWIEAAGGKTTQAVSDPEYLADFAYPKAKKTKGLDRIKRRMKQFWSVVFGKEFSARQDLMDTMNKRYSNPEEIDFYAQYVSFGIHGVEEKPIAKALSKLEGMRRRNALVVGCGTGRECFYLEELGFDVTGVDLNPRMVQVARETAKRRGSSVEFYRGTLRDGFLEEKFQLVVPTFGLNNHVQGRVHRVDLLRQMRRRTEKDGVMILYRDDYPVPMFSKVRLASWILKLRWFGAAKWEPGDSVKSFLGPHAGCEQMIYWHYYPTRAHLDREIQDAGLKTPDFVDRLIEARPEDAGS